MEESAKPGDRYFKAVLEVINDSIARLAKSDGERKFYESLLAGGNQTAANVVAYCEGIKELYGEGSASKALELTKVFTLLMLAQSYRWLNEHEEKKVESDESTKAAALNALAVFGDGDEKSVELFLRMKTQFDYDSDHHPSMVHMGGLMLGWAAEAMGHKCVDWEKAKFPVKSMSALTHSGVVLDSTRMRSPGDIKALWGCHGIGCRALMEHYEGKKVDGKSSADNTGAQ